MDQRILDLTPSRYLCPYCGEWHEWDLPHGLGYYDSTSYQAELGCEYQRSSSSPRRTFYYFENDCCHYRTMPICRRANFEIDDKISISDIIEHSDKPCVTYSVPFTASEYVGGESCSMCGSECNCQICKLGRKNDGYNMNITFGFEFDWSDYIEFAKAIHTRKEEELQEREDAISRKEQDLEDRENAVTSREQLYQQSQVKESKKEAIMETTTKKTSIKTMLYEKSPKENLQTIKEFTEKYKPTLKWAVPTAAVYVAYRILNSDKFDLSVNNISDVCEEKLGFKLEFLENKRTLKEMMAIGGIVAGTYGVTNAVSGFFGNKKEEEISVEEIEDGMNKLESISNKFSWMQPKMADMLPIAFSVIFVYVILHKPMPSGKIANKMRALTEDFKIKIDMFIELAKMFIEDKFNIDLSDEQEQRKMKICASLVVFIGIFVLLYGKKVLGKKDNSENEKEVNEREISSSVEKFVEQAKAIIKKIAPTVYTTLISLLISNKLLEESLEYFEEDEDFNDFFKVGQNPENEDKEPGDESHNGDTKKEEDPCKMVFGAGENPESEDEEPKDDNSDSEKTLEKLETTPTEPAE